MVGKYLKLLVVSTFIFILATGSVSAADYYVATNGNDSGSGASGSPFKTITKAISVANGGDRIFVSPGLYAPFTVSKSGSSGSPISIIGNQARVSGGQNGIKLSGNYINLSGFEVSDTWSHGILVTGKNIKVSKFIVRDSVNENRTNGSSSSDGKCTSTGWGSGLKVQLGGENIVFEDGSVFRNCGEGVAITRGLNVVASRLVAYDNFSVNFYIDNSKDVILQQSLSYCTDDSRFYSSSGNPARGITFGEEVYSGWGAQLGNVTVINNIISGCRSITLYQQFAEGGIKGALIAHNTVHNLRGSSYGIDIASYPQNQNIIVRNNIFPGTIRVGSGSVVSNNISTTTYATTPSYLNPNSFMPAANSNAVNSGFNLGITTDFAGNVRPVGSAPDIGAFEYGSSGGVVPTFPPSPSPIATLLGDLNNDRIVNNQDYQIFLSDYGKTGTVSDINKDGKVNIFDYNILVTNYGKSI